MPSPRSLYSEQDLRSLWLLPSNPTAPTPIVPNPQSNSPKFIVDTLASAVRFPFNGYD